MRAVISKWGNSPAIRINKALMEEANLSVDQPVDIVVKDGHIEIHQLEVEEYDLDEMLSQMKPYERYEDVDFGPPVGKEFW